MATSPQATQPLFSDRIQRLEVMRKWNCSFDGKNIHSFLERVEELKTAYEFTDEQIVQGFPILLKDEALLWFRNLDKTDLTWKKVQESLRAYFLGPEEARSLLKQIHDRHQGAKESIQSYVTAISTLVRRKGGYDLNSLLDTLYYNMKPELQLHIRRSEINSINELILKAQQTDDILRQLHKERKDLKPTHTQ